MREMTAALSILSFRRSRAGAARRRGHTIAPSFHEAPIGIDQVRVARDLAKQDTGAIELPRAKPFTHGGDRKEPVDLLALGEDQPFKTRIDVRSHGVTQNIPPVSRSLWQSFAKEIGGVLCGVTKTRRVFDEQRIEVSGTRRATSTISGRLSERMNCVCNRPSLSFKNAHSFRALLSRRRQLRTERPRPGSWYPRRTDWPRTLP